MVLPLEMSAVSAPPVGTSVALCSGKACVGVRFGPPTRSYVTSNGRNLVIEKLGDIDLVHE